MRAALKAVPDGEYVFEDVMDDDGLGTVDIPIKVKVTIKGSKAKFDFSGTSPQVRGNINITFNATQAAVCYSLKALLDPDVPNNQGVLDVPDIVAERGSLVNAVFPAPVAARANTSQRIIDVVIGALAKACPDAAVAAANGANTTAVFSGTDPRTGRQYVYLETLGGGMGARATKDGRDGVQVHITNTSNLPVEAIETEYPLFVESYSLVEDSRRRRKVSRWHGAAPGDRTGGSRGQFQRRRRTFPQQALGPVRRAGGNVREVCGAARGLPAEAPRRQAVRDQSGSG